MIATTPRTISPERLPVSYTETGNGDVLAFWHFELAEVELSVTLQHDGASGADTWTYEVDEYDDDLEDWTSHEITAHQAGQFGYAFPVLFT